MPRTRTVKNSKVDPKEPINWTVVNKMLDDAEQKEKEALKQFYEAQLRAKNVYFEGFKMNFPSKMFYTTMAKLLRGDFEETTAASTLLSNSAYTTTSDLHKSRRSASLGAEEGCLTVDSGNSTAGERSSRSQTKHTGKRTSGAVSRSLSRTNTGKHAAPAFKTPTRKQVVYTITPKCKLNLPQVALRRPKQGEMAVSLQGSPIYTGPVIADSTANVNIPLQNGDLFMLQPERGLRMSQFPPMDKNLHKQLQVLRDHLNKVCALNYQ